MLVSELKHAKGWCTGELKRWQHQNFFFLVMFGGDTEEGGIKMKIWLLAWTIGAVHYDRKKGNGGCCPEGSEGEGNRTRLKSL